MAKYRRPEDLNRIESEAGIIATLIHHPDFAFHSEFLTPEHFSNKQNQIIYRALSGMSGEQIQTIDTYGIQEYIKRNDVENIDVIPKESIDELINMSSVLARHSVKDYKILVSNVFDVAFRREMLSKMDECKAILMDPSEEDVKKLFSGRVLYMVHITACQTLGRQQRKTPPQASYQPCRKACLVIQRSVQIEHDGPYAA